MRKRKHGAGGARYPPIYKQVSLVGRLISRCERIQETISVIWSNMSLNETQDIQVTVFYEVVQERAFIANGSTIDKSKVGRTRV